MLYLEAARFLTRHQYTHNFLFSDSHASVLSESFKPVILLHDSWDAD